MVTLSLDTSTRAGSCAVLRDSRVLAESPGDPATSHAERLPKDLDAVLARGGVPLDRVDVFAVAIGPGSFTSVRVGIATMQGLALAAGKPLVGVSVLDALARTVHDAGDPSGRVATWVDAWRGDVFAALYERGAAVSEPTVDRPERILAGLAGVETVFVGGGAAAHREVILRAMGGLGRLAAEVDPLLAAVIGRAAGEQVERGHRPGPAEIQALYVRRPDVDPPEHAHVER